MTIRILHVLNSLGNGGAESFIFNVYRNIDRNIIQFDFLLRSKNNNSKLIDEVEKMGGKIFITPEFPKHPVANYKAVKHFFKTHNEYKVIHVHANALLYITPLILARKLDIQHRILHSHSTATKNNFMFKKIHLFNRLFIKIIAKHFYACGYEAGKWMFGEQEEFKIINNAIDTEKYVIDPVKRNNLRSEMGIEDGFVIGHVGRFVKPKNHTFLIDIFKEIYNSNPKAYLVLIGEGELLPQIKEKVDRLNLSKNVFFLGQRPDVPDLLQVVDTFVFPSIFEGIPIALIEAQAAGLKCFVSDRVSPKSKITKLVRFLSIKDSSAVWANEILMETGKSIRLNMSSDIKLSNYDISDNAKKLEDMYLDMLK